MHILIDNLNEMTTARHLTNLFLPFGVVLCSKIIHDDMTGRSQRIGFIDMESGAGKKAIQLLNRCLFMNSYLDVSEV